MNHFTRELVETLSSPEKTKEIVRQHLEEAMNTMLKNELDAVLGYQKYQRGQRDGNSRNGSYDRSYDTEYGEVNLNVPRDRKNEFEPKLFDPYQRRSDWLESMIIELYQKGSTISEIADIIEKLYGHYYSKETISNITEATQVLVDQLRQDHSRNVTPSCILTRHSPRLDGEMLPVRQFIWYLELTKKGDEIS